MEKRVKHFIDDGLGLFIHYGVYAKFELGEWYWEMQHLTEKDYYHQVGKQFKLTPNFEQIIRQAKQHGFKYVVLTSKHHDGFGLYDSQGLSKYDINWLEEQTDIVDQFIQTCVKYQIKPFLYYATMEWTDQAQQNFTTHVNSIYQNVELLANRYQTTIAGWWFDGNWSNPEGNWQLDKLYQMLRASNPDTIIVNNTGLEHKGEISHPEIDAVTFEQGRISEVSKFSKLKDKAFEVCYGLNDHWGSAEFDFAYKPASKLITDFVTIRQYHGNFLVNVGLDKHGKIGLAEQAVLQTFGAWNKLNHHALQKPYHLISHTKQYLVIKTSPTIYKIYLFNLKSGAHIDNIHYGNATNQLLKVNLKARFKSIKKIIYADNNQQVTANLDNKCILIYPQAFSYGYNTLVRIIELELGA